MPNAAPSRKTAWWKKTGAHWFIVVFACLASFGVGWFSQQVIADQPVPAPKSLRLSGYQFISPLLSCNLAGTKQFPEFQKISGDIQSVIDTHEKTGDISKASTYFIDFSNGYWSDTDEDDTYYPSSLGKIPIMMAYFELAESSNSILDERITYPTGSADLNDTQDIPPPQAIVPGQTYTVNQLIDYMIEDSDNNAAQLLYENIDQNALRNVYSDLDIPVNDDATISNLDFITPQQISTLFRVLYNATYLSRDYSEEALQIMSQSTFTQGLVAGVPSSTVVSHKLGLVGIAANGGPSTEHELHDCGIVYAPNHPYLLCVMTRGSSTLPTMENVIADISRTVYTEVENNYK